MGAVDPTYPLFPIASFLAVALLLLVLLTRLIRQKWNLGVCFLSFWLLVLNAINGTNAIIWSDNADIKLYAYCSIVTRIQLVCFVVKSTATFIIIRRLYIVANSRSIGSPSKAARHWDMFVEWTSGLIIPLLVSGPFYYVVQDIPFQIFEGFGCTNAYISSVLTYLLIVVWPVIFPLISVTVYYPKVAYTFYCHSKEVNRYLRTKTSEVSRTSYIRVLILASIDLFLTLPLSATNLILTVIAGLHDNLPFYPGWDHVHSSRDWVPILIPYSELKASHYDLGSQYFDWWTTPILAYLIFCLFGLTPEARASYWHVFSAISERVTWRSSPRETRTSRSPLASMEFQTRPREMSLSGCSISQPGLVDITSSAASNGLESSVRQRCDEMPELENNDVR